MSSTLEKRPLHACSRMRLICQYKLGTRFFSSMRTSFRNATVVLTMVLIGPLTVTQADTPPCRASNEVQEHDGAPSAIGCELSVSNHLRDGKELILSLGALLRHGKALFEARWTTQEGGGRPLTKGTGLPVADSRKPLSGNRGFNRVSGPDANSCQGCHNAPHGIAGGGGDFVTNVFVLGQRWC